MPFIQMHKLIALKNGKKVKCIPEDFKIISGAYHTTVIRR